MFDSFVKKKAIQAKDAVVESVKQDIQSSPGLVVGIIGGALLLIGLVASALSGPAQTGTTQPTTIVINNYLSKEDDSDDD